MNGGKKGMHYTVTGTKIDSPHYLFKERMGSPTSTVFMVFTNVRVFVCYMHIFRSSNRDSSQYTQVRVGFKRLNFDHDICLIIGRRFMGQLAKPAFTIAFGEDSLIDVKFYFYPLQCRKELRKPVVSRRSMILPARIYSNTNAPTNN